MRNLFVVVGISGVIWLTFLSLLVYRIKRHYDQLIKGAEEKTLSHALDRIIKALENEQEHTKTIEGRIEKIIQESKRYIQKIGILRFNPFKDTGGNQSFILTLLDGTNTGVVLTALNNRGVIRWYAKHVSEGKGVDNPLSEEEQEAMKSTMHPSIRGMEGIKGNKD